MADKKATTRSLTSQVQDAINEFEKCLSHHSDSSNLDRELASMDSAG